MRVAIIPLVIGTLGTVPRRQEKKTGEIENQRTNRVYPNNNIAEIGQNTEKSPGNLRRLAVTETLVNDHLLKLVRKTLKK